ncbi:MAG: RluA family pseudouridine synthase [Spirochaetes bacterium]|nr:RluA family pseudouridine synthase [Spirochaetota bacterium]
MRSSGPRPHGGRYDVLFAYEDEDIIVVEKPEGLSVISAEGSRALSLYDIVTAHIRKTNPKGRAAVVHRLDRDSSGIMVFATHARAKKALMENWNELVFERGYAAVAEGVFRDKAGCFDSWLVENRGGQVYTARPGAPGALRSVTNWKVESSSPRYTLLYMSLETGRKHQIRAQLAEVGHPVAGDSRYGARTDPLGRLCLHASILGLEHPFTHERFSFESPPPEGFTRLVEGRRDSHETR